MGEAEDSYLIASDAGYGFVVKLEEFLTKNKAGKTLIKPPESSLALAPQRVNNKETDIIAALTNEGKLLVFGIKDLPELTKGKGNKIINIPSSKARAREELMVAVAVLAKDQSLMIQSGSRSLTLKPKDLESYKGERGRRGFKLPRGFQQATSMVAV